MVYQWKIDKYANVSAQAAGEEIEKCRDGNGFIQPESVVNIAKPEESPIHTCFEWNNYKAAKKYRVVQAQELIRNVVVVNVIEREPEQPVRAFINIKKRNERGYKTIDVVVRNKYDSAYMLETAKRELDAFKQKYMILLELNPALIPLFTEIDKILDKKDDGNDGKKE